MHGMHPTAYFRATINAWCLATSLPAVLHSLEIKSPWEAAACQRYLRTGAASSCAHTREADGSCTRHMSPAQAGQGRAQHRGTSLLEIPAFPTKNTAPLFLCSICRARDGKEQSRSLLCPGFLRSSASSDGAEHLQHPLLLALIRQEESQGEEDTFYSQLLGVDSAQPMGLFLGSPQTATLLVPPQCLYREHIPCLEKKQK